jgi:hypothetical protein
MFSAYKDFEPVAEELTKVNEISSFKLPRIVLKCASQQGQKPPYDWDKYAQVFFPKAEELLAIAEKAEHEGHKDKASEYYLYGKSTSYTLVDH